MNTLIKNSLIITMCSEEQVMENGYIAICDDKITYVGTEIPKGFTAQIIIDAKNKVVLPGFTNMHTHSPMVLLRSYADDLPLQEWLFDKVFPIEDKILQEDTYWLSLLAIMEMIKSGTTCFADMYFNMEQVAKAVSKAGIRAHLSRGLQCFNDSCNISEDKRLNENIDLYNEWNGAENGRIKVGFAPHAVYTCVPRYLSGCIDIADKLGAKIHTHLSETEKETRECIKKYGKTPVEHLYDLGMFKLDTIAAHCVHVTEKDIDILAKNNVNIIYNPGSNLKLGSGISPVVRFIQKGINVALGTDGAASNNNLDIMEEIHLASLISKGVLEEPTAIKAFQALEMATVNAAKALGENDTIGRIKEGMKADLIILDTKKPHYYPVHNIVSNIVYSGKSSDIELVMIDGNIIMEKNEFKTLDFEEIIYNVNRIKERMF